MRKMVFLPVFLALCVIDFYAFGAINNRRGTANDNVPAAPVRAATTRSVVRSAVSGAPASQNTTVTRSGPRQVVTPSANGARSAVARAGSTQKAINLGTKVQSATENTVISQECQDAYYGCMDAFCMLDNASGGRCQCSDRNADLDLVLEEIMKLDEQSLAMATEGVERLQMGENAEEIMARAKAVADNVTKPDQKLGVVGSGTVSGGKVVRTLDLSAWRNGSLFDDGDSVFDASAFESMQSSVADKSGDALQTAASKICIEKIPSQCKSSGSFLQLTYSQKIKSDCTAYENSLKQQRSASAEKLQIAQKALRDAALEMYQNENKYDLGGCVLRFKQCLQTTGECGEDYTGCVADTTILDSLYGKKSNKIATTTIKTGATSIKISSATYDILNSKKVMCESVTKQCVNANKKDAVWSQVIKDIAPVIYSAEYSAASNSRMNCINTAVKCVQTVCGSQWDKDTDNYDACLSDPELVASSCQLELYKCNGAGDTTTQTRVWEYVKAKLAAMQVDKCTKDVKACLLSEDHCGPDYSECIGLSTSAVLDMCHENLFVSCQDRAGRGSGEQNWDTRDYITKVAKGIALSIDNKFATQCQNAADAAMERICGTTDEDEEDCPGLAVNGTEIDASLRWQYCIKGTTTCSDNVTSFGANEIADVEPRLNGLLNVGKISFNKNATDENYFKVDASAGTDDALYGYTDTNDANLNKLVQSMNRNFSSVLSSVEADATVRRCTGNINIENFSSDRTKDIKSSARFSHLLDGIKTSVGNKIFDSAISEYNSKVKTALDSKTRKEMQYAIKKRATELNVSSEDGENGAGGGNGTAGANAKYVIAQCRTTRDHMNNNTSPISKYSTPKTLKELFSSSNLDCSTSTEYAISECFKPCGNNHGSTRDMIMNSKYLKGIDDFCAGLGFDNGNTPAKYAFLFSKPDENSSDSRYTAKVYNKDKVDEFFEAIAPGTDDIDLDANASWVHHTWFDNCDVGIGYWYLLAFKLEKDPGDTKINRDSDAKATLYRAIIIGK